MSDDCCPIPVHDLDELALAHAEVKKRLVPWLAKLVVRMLVDIGTPPDDIQPIAERLVLCGYQMLADAYARRVEELAAEFRGEAAADDDEAANDDQSTSKSVLH